MSDNFVEERGWLARVTEYRPDVSAVSVITGHQRWVGKTVERLAALRPASQPAPLVLVGGPHPTYFPGMVLDPWVDLFCRGDGGESPIDLANALAFEHDKFLTPLPEAGVSIP